MKPINLKEQFGDRFKIGLDEAAEHERKLASNPWYFIIPCKYGHIYPHDDRLAVFCDGPRIIERLKLLPGLSAYVIGDGEAIFTFPLSEFNAVAEIVQARRRRRLSDKHKAALVDAGRDHRY